MAGKPGVLKERGPMVAQPDKEMIMRLTIAVFVLLFAVQANAATWCKWDGSQGINCTSTNRTSAVLDGHRVTVSAENLNPRGWYELVVTEPTIGADQVRGQTIWALVGNQITKTWEVQDMTTEDIDQRIARPMSLSDYYQWKVLLETGVITVQQARNHIPQELIDAYQARKRLEQ